MKILTTLLGLLLAGVIHAQQPPDTNVALVATATQSSVFVRASNANDGNTNTFSLTGSDQNAWLELALVGTNWIDHLEVWPRRGSAPTNFWVFVSNQPFSSGTTNVALDPDASTWHYHFEQWVNFPQKLVIRRLARFVRFQLDYTGQLEIGELAVQGSSYTGAILTMQHRDLVTISNGVRFTNRQDGLIVIGVPGQRYDIDTRTGVDTNWTRYTNTIATNYEHRWYGPKSRSTGELFFRTLTNTNGVVQLPLR